MGTSCKTGWSCWLTPAALWLEDPGHCHIHGHDPEAAAGRYWGAACWRGGLTNAKPPSGLVWVPPMHSIWNDPTYTILHHGKLSSIWSVFIFSIYYHFLLFLDPFLFDWPLCCFLEGEDFFKNFLNFLKGGKEERRNKDHFPWRLMVSKIPWRFLLCFCFHQNYQLCLRISIWGCTLSILMLQLALIFDYIAAQHDLSFAKSPLALLFPLYSRSLALNLKNIFKHLFQILCPNFVKICHISRNDEY
jgi:hypothetical protein